MNRVLVNCTVVLALIFCLNRIVISNITLLKRPNNIRINIIQLIIFIILLIKLPNLTVIILAVALTELSKAW